MASDRDTLVAELKYLMGDRDDLDTRYPIWIRRAYAHLTQSIEFPEGEEQANIVMVATQRVYALPSDYLTLYSLRNDEVNKKMFRVSQSEYSTLLVTATGHPDRYCVYSEQLYVHPTPDTADTLTANYRRILPDLTLGSSVHLLPDVWDQAIIQLAASFGFEATNEIERATYYRTTTTRFTRTQRKRMTGDLFDRNEPMAPIGGEIN